MIKPKRHKNKKTPNHKTSVTILIQDLRRITKFLAVCSMLSGSTIKLWEAFFFQARAMTEKTLFLDHATCVQKMAST